MLEKLLKLIGQGGSLIPSVIAKQLNTSTGMVEMMLEELSRRGLLKTSEYNKDCDSDACGSCYLSKTCNSTQQRVWMTTENSK